MKRRWTKLTNVRGKGTEKASFFFLLFTFRGALKLFRSFPKWKIISTGERLKSHREKSGKVTLCHTHVTSRARLMFKLFYSGHETHVGTATCLVLTLIQYALKLCFVSTCANTLSQVNAFAHILCHSAILSYHDKRDFNLKLGPPNIMPSQWQLFIALATICNYHSR